MRRRDFMGSLVAFGASCAAPVVRAETPGRVLFGFTLTPSIEAMIVAVLTHMRADYRPDLGARPVFLPGNSGVVAMETVSRAAPDGATAFLSSSPSMTLLPLVLNLKLAPAEMLHPTGGIGEFTYAFVVGPAVPADVRSMSAYLAWAAVNPGTARYGVPGRGTASHFIGTELARLSGVALKSVPYKGLVPLIDDVASGTIPAGITVRVGAVDIARYPSLRTFAVSSATRWPGSPDVPTLLELGFAESPTTPSVGFFLPPRTPAEKVAEMAAAIHRAVQDPVVRATMASAGIEPLRHAGDYALQIAGERAEWTTRIARGHFTPDA